MLSDTEKTMLQELLNMAPVPEQTMSFHELMGYMFGLAITPADIPGDEWMSAVFGDDPSGISALDQAQSMRTILDQVFQIFVAKELRGELDFPYNVEELQEADLLEVLEWVSGFEEAISLRDNIWAPDDAGDIDPTLHEELYFSHMVLQGLTEPEEMTEFFEKLPDEVLAEAFVTYEPGQHNKLQQIQAFLLATLPLAIKTLRQHAEVVAATPTLRILPAKSNTESSQRELDQAKPSQVKKGKVIEVDFATRRKVTKPSVDHAIYQIKITLHGAKPPIWRRLLVPDTITLSELHHIIQRAMGWQNSHYHQFEIGDKLYSNVTDQIDDGENKRNTLDEAGYSLHDLSPHLEPSFAYTYDMGDNWHHILTIEHKVATEEGMPYPVLVKGQRACPPEDCGGIPGYLHLLEAYLDTGHPEHQTVREWVGEGFAPEDFSDEVVAEINDHLRSEFS